MNYVLDFLGNGILWTGIVSWLVAQLFKMLITILVEKRFSWERLFGDGGMPSGHSATVTAIALSSGWCFGFHSVYFALAGTLAVIVMHDAVGVRREAGKQATSIKQLAELINGLVGEKDELVRTDKLKELVGHTPLQVFFGFLLGAAVTVVAMVVFGAEYCGGAFSLFA